MSRNYQEQTLAGLTQFKIDLTIPDYSVDDINELIVQRIWKRSNVFEKK